ncbi:hypothetical protein BO82DRAFT_434646 [Aspergillus uvarum CBS 121591]|uniref:PKS/mFAS DH domain-containing protein n=1 Tax=Aspergillus uvarum CBS 121591 TaxID=1448315 RepID=A0A319BYI6_9EURO|nr:hypothetical protein BO82DRAFT_434646 [Aspergillus uvarum CBS 121591]PYH78776.1 hypothetical protein BO82DRAFT_434646 [Aspergillus uvarum CBS 121591]
MLAVGLSPADAAPYLAGSQSVSIACFNSTTNVTLSGDEAAIDALKAVLDAVGIFARKLRTGVTYHPHHLHSVTDAYAETIGEVEPAEKYSSSNRSSRVIMVSTVSGQRVPAETLREGSYWASNLVRPVRFLQAFRGLLSKRGVVKKLDGSHRLLMDITYCLEIGPHGALRGPTQEILQAQDQTMSYLAPLQRGLAGVNSLLQADEEEEKVRVMPPSALVSLADLPSYAWDHSRNYFLESRTSRNHRLRNEPRSKLLGETAVDWNPLDARWGNFLIRSEHPWIEDHRINGTVLFPAAGMMAMAVEAMQQQGQHLADDRAILGYELCDISLSTALVIPDHERGVEVQFSLRCQPGGGDPGSGRDHRGWWSDFRLCAYLEGSEWEEICSGAIRVDFGVAPSGIGTQRVAEARQHQRSTKDGRPRQPDR